MSATQYGSDAGLVEVVFVRHSRVRYDIELEPEAELCPADTRLYLREAFKNAGRVITPFQARIVSRCGVPIRRAIPRIARANLGWEFGNIRHLIAWGAVRYGFEPTVIALGTRVCAEGEIMFPYVVDYGSERSIGLLPQYCSTEAYEHFLLIRHMPM